MGYEFSDSDAGVIKRVGMRLTAQGIILFLAGIGGIIYSAINYSTGETTDILIYLIQSIVEVVIGISLLLSPSYFSKVGKKKGMILEN